jgi:hypothetical protein
MKAGSEGVKKGRQVGEERKVTKGRKDTREGHE